MKQRYRLLVVDDEPANLQKLRRTFMQDFDVREAGDGDQALRMLRHENFAVIITDQRMPRMTGVELLKESLKVSPDSVRIILTGYTEVDELMDAINRGHVHRYITKPWDPPSLRETVKREVERWELKRENERLARELELANQKLAQENLRLRSEVEALRDGDSDLIYESQAMKDLLGMLDRVVETDSTVLIQGETGTGKELLARHIHDASPRAKQPFVPVNCGAIPSDLVESTFFGHHKGAFTGASSSKKGYFELADRGTLFLDEIGEAPLDLQVKLLRVLQQGEIYPVGAESARDVDVRIIASTNRDLAQRVAEGSFRQDLFFRLNVFAVHVPPLRARSGDIEVLSRYFLEKACARLNKSGIRFTRETLDQLNDYEWPGNVRELENEVERLAILSVSGESILPEMLSERIRLGSEKKNSSGDLKEQLFELERELILRALRKHNENKTQAARDLGITRQTIISKLKQYRDR